MDGATPVGGAGRSARTTWQQHPGGRAAVEPSVYFQGHGISSKMRQVPRVFSIVKRIGPALRVLFNPRVKPGRLLGDSVTDDRRLGLTTERLQTGRLSIEALSRAPVVATERSIAESPICQSQSPNLSIARSLNNHQSSIFNLQCLQGLLMSYP